MPRVASPASAGAAPRAPHSRLLAALRDVLAGAFGADAYAGYLAHLARHHPEQVPLSRAAFFRERQDARWSGITRCC
jgi:uncharacterized short protein YbdD (DUF466 family)